MKKINFPVAQYFTKNDVKIVLICVFIRVFLFSLCDYKISECPDSWAFNHFSEKLTAYKNNYLQNPIDSKTKNFNADNSKTTATLSVIENEKKGSFVGERSPGYPLLIFIASGKNGIVFVQFFLGICTALLWYRILLKLRFSNSFSFFTVVVLQCFVSIFMYETFILVEAVVLFLLSLVSYYISDDYLSTPKSLAFELFFSFILGYLVLVKPFFVVIPCILFALKFLNKPHFKVIFNRKLLGVIVPLLFFFGWSLVVQKFTGYYTSTTYYGLNKAQNCVYFAEKGPKEYNWIIEPYVKHREIAIKEKKDVSMSIWFALNEGEFKHKNMEFPELSNEFGKFADATIKSNLGDYFHQIITKSWLDFWISFDIKGIVHFENPKSDFWITEIASIQNFILTVLNFLFLPISLFYIFQFLLKKVINFQVIFSSLIWSISILQAVITYGTNGKYCYPFEFLIVFILLLFARDYLVPNRFFNKIAK